MIANLTVNRKRINEALKEAGITNARLDATKTRGHPADGIEFNQTPNEFAFVSTTIPIKLQLFDSNGAPVANAVVHLNVWKASNFVPSDLATDSGDLVPNGSTDIFRYDATTQQYIYNLGTKALAASGTGTYYVYAALDDGTYQLVTIGLK